MADRADDPAETRRRPLLWFALLAAVAGLIAVFASRLNEPASGGPILLNPPTLGVDSRVRVSWRASAEAPRFLVDVRSPDGVPRFAASSETLTLDLPPDVSAEIVRGANFVWTVTALDGEGKPTTSSASEALSPPDPGKQP